MGRDITLYPERASRKDLSEYLEGLGFQRCSHYWEWPKGTLHYFWFEDHEFKSIDGVSADVFPVPPAERISSQGAWALHVRNVYSASWHDVAMLNAVLRGARRRFGGTIKGDYGTNRYALLWEDKSTPISRGLTRVYLHVQEQIAAVKHALPEPSFSHPALPGGKTDALADFTITLDPSRVIYNGLVPFAVAMFEYFFSQAFQVLIAYDKVALEKRSSHKAKVEFSAMVDLDSKRRSIENIIAEAYTFQNLDQLNKAYRDWLDIDVRKVLLKKNRIGKTIHFLEKKIGEIIEYRHGIVHHFVIDRSLTRDAYVHILDAVSMAIEEFVSHVEIKYQLKIDRY